MKLTKSKLNQMIKEELSFVSEAEGEEVMAAIENVPGAARKIADKVKVEIEKMAAPTGLDPLILAQAVSALLTAE